jgi:hypothetical protein
VCKLDVDVGCVGSVGFGDDCGLWMRFREDVRWGRCWFAALALSSDYFP